MYSKKEKSLSNVINIGDNLCLFCLACSIYCGP